MNKIIKFILAGTAVAACALTLSACGVGLSASSNVPQTPGESVTDKNPTETVTPPEQITPPSTEEPDGSERPSPPDATDKPDKPVKHTATFTYKNEVYATREFTDETEIDFPEVPEREHYTGEWKKLSQDDGNLTFSAVYTPVTYYLAVLGEDGGEITKIEYNAETPSEVLNGKLPPLPQKPHYTASWSGYAPFDEAALTRPEYTPIIYSVTFVNAGGETVAVKTYTFENQEISEPEVPELEGYENGRWQSYKLNFENITVRPVYDKIPDPAETFTEGLVFTLNEVTDSYEITGYTGTETEIKIPSVYEGKSVTAIAESAFSNTSATKITVANGVTKIMAQAFYNCSAEKIILPETLEFIGKSAFNSCTKLREITIPDSVTEIEAMSFAGCASLITAKIGVGVKLLPANLFVNCAKLQTVMLASHETKASANTFNNCPLFKGVTYMT